MEISTHIREAAHPTPRTYASVAAVLAAITGVEVGIFYIEAIRGVVIPMFIVLSAAKFAMVAMFYMHLKFDSRLFSGLFVGGLMLAASVIIALMALFGVLLNTPTAAAVAEGPGESATTKTEDTIAPPGGVILEIASVSSDDLKFNKDALTARAGAAMVLTFTNKAITQQHNWTLVQNGTKDAVSTAGLAYPTSDWVSPTDERVVAHTKLIAAGTSEQITFTAPAAGTYQFVCTFPGHNLTMFGSFEVSP
jgi:cytochrome c oxidase subunit 4